MKDLKAKDFDNDYQYQSYKKQTKKADQQNRQQRTNKRSMNW